MSPLRTLLCALLLLAWQFGPGAWAQPRFTILTYNTENTFDTLAAPGGGDADFLPQGSHHWTRARYLRKLRRIAQVMLAADTLHPVDLAILQEVESDEALRQLLSQTPLATIPYEYVITHSADPRGINVALIYSPHTFRLLLTDTIALPGAATRQVLYACGLLNSGDTLHLYALHLPSQLGGRKAQHLRASLCDSIAAHIRRSTAGSAAPLVLVAGDFNDQPSASCIRNLCRQAGLINRMQGLTGGSYKWRGRWQWLDQMLLSPAFAPRCQTPCALKNDFLLEDDILYGGKKPFRAFMGPVWHDGYSDHLPVVLRLGAEP